MPDPDDPEDDLRYAARVRFDLWAHSPVEIDPDTLIYRTRPHGANRDAERLVYFEVATDMLEEVKRVLRDYGHAQRVNVTEVEEGEACQNCGKIAGRVFPTICPACGHRDIDPCPRCGEEVPRQEYQSINGDLFQCPRCGGHVRLQLNPHLLNANLTLKQPVVVVSSVGA
ncbi:MAG: hypothetical protein ACREHD_02670 [Pirellulales bacterium]